LTSTWVIKDIALKGSFQFRAAGSLEEQRQRLSQIEAGYFDRVTLTGDVELRAKGDVSITFPFDQDRTNPGKPTRRTPLRIKHRAV
jgi:hypothetical protein